MSAPAPVGAAEVHARLLARRETVAVAESLTGGLISAALSATAGASETFRGGVVVYATDLKASLAGVPTPLLDAEGPVSAEVAAALAGGVRLRLGADLGLAVTGVAGPDPVGDQPVGSVFLAVARPDGARVTHELFTGDRHRIREQTVRAALALLADALPGTPGRSPAL